MLLNIIDGQGEPQVVCAQAQATPIDRGGTITAPNAMQVLMAANANRSGWLVQNPGPDIMSIDDIGAGTVGQAPPASAYQLAAGRSFPPPGYPVTTGQILISGPDAADPYIAREW